MQAIVYSVTSDPNRIECSIEDHDSTVDLTVQINNKKDVVNIDKLTLHIPVGGTDNDGFALSTDNKLPEPIVGAGEDQWKVTRDGSDVTIEPKPGAPNGLASTLIFTLPNIKVNKMPGNVPISFNESFPPKTGTLELVKVASTFLVSRFYAERNGKELNPPVLYDLDQRVKLKWDCTSAAQKNYSFSLRTTKGQAWQPKDCLNRRDCYSCRDGKDGVETNELKQTTEFALDVIKVEGETPTVTQTLFVTVDVVRPVIDDAHVGDTYFKGRVARLHWRALNATSCEIKIGTKKFADNLPTDTYHDGYLVPLAGGSSSYEPWVFAKGVEGPPVSRDFPPVSVDALSLIETGVQLISLTISPDGRWALGTDGGFKLVLIDLSAGNARTLPTAWPFTVLPSVSGIAFTADGRSALIVADLQILVMDIPSGQFRGPASVIQNPADYDPISVPGLIAVGGNYALVTGSANGPAVFNIASSRIERYVPLTFVISIAIAPNGSYALIGNGIGQLASIRLTASRGNPVPVRQGSPFASVITSDGRRAFVLAQDFTNPNSNDRTLGILPGNFSDPFSFKPIYTTRAAPISIALTTPTENVPEVAVVSNQNGSLTLIRSNDLTTLEVPLDPGIVAGQIVISKTGGLNNHGVGLIATNKNHVIRFDVDELPWRPKSSGS